MDIILWIVLGLAGGSGLSYVALKSSAKGAKAKADHVVKDAEQKKINILAEANREASKVAAQARADEEERKRELRKTEERMVNREEQLDQKLERLETTRMNLDEKLDLVRKREEELGAQENEMKETLSKTAKLTKDEAKETLLSLYEKEFEGDILAHVAKVEERVKDEADKKSQKILASAIQKYAQEVATESMSTVVNLPSDDMKGRIIGREGRNINALEHATGVDIIVDDTPGSIMISGFDLMRRFIAKRSLETLIEDGRIHPARIEEVVDKVREDTNELMKEFGEKALMELGITGLHPNLVKLVGRLRFRTSYGQNILKHSMEVGYIAAQIAQEIGADVKLAKMAGFFHDIGKAVTHEVEGPHALIGATILRKFNMDEKLINCVESHHGDVEAKYVEGILITAADAISGARPGARSDTADDYVKRMQDLENVCASFEGVNRVFAIQAGREVRVIVNPEEISDLDAKKLSQKIARAIEEELQYPGEIKVNVIREMRIEEFAR